MLQELQIDETNTVLDVGISPEEDLPDTNYLEKHYPYPNKLTALGVEDCSALPSLYPGVKIIQGSPGAPLPFEEGHYDVVTSWATLEHVGDQKRQAYFLKECLRVGKKVFLTVPYRGCIYEPHTGFFFAHWLPLKLFRKLCIWSRKPFWADENNLNPLFIHDIKKMIQTKGVEIRTYRMFGILSSHLLIIKK